MFVDFFIKKPVFTTVCAIIVLLVGAVSIPTLPTAQYPEISPTQILVSSNYVGASAEVVETTVTTVLERQINGIEGINYMTSISSNDGSSSITVTFDSSKDKDIAAVDVQNRVSLAQPQLPSVVQQTGVTVSKQSSNILLAMGFYSDHGEFDNVFLSNYADLYLVDALKRIDGVSNAQIFGERRYAMRIWLDPNKLASRNLTTDDVVSAIKEQNLQVGIGQIGQPPTTNNQEYQIDLTAVSRLVEPEEFGNLILRTDANGTLIKLKDVGRVTLGAESYTSFLRFRGQEGVGIGILPSPGSNVLDVARAVKAKMKLLSLNFPPGMKYKVAFDTTSFVEASLTEVVKTLFEAIALVVVVIFIFLQDWRTTLIPIITIPLTLIGTFAFVKVSNFSINTLTMFGLTLATGLVVDDAIIVVENISRLIEHENLSPAKAASKSMRELYGALISIALVLMAVFVPVAFFPGTTGLIYKQFALTIVFSIIISTFFALTLTPALSAQLLRPGQKPRGWLGWIFDRINGFIEWLRRSYHWILIQLNELRFLVVLLFIAALGLTGWFYAHVPQGFLPEEDQGYFITIIQGPEGSSLNHTSEVMKGVETELLKIPEVTGTFALGGFGFSGNTANNAAIFSTLIPWDMRKGPGQSAQAIIGKLRQKLSTITEARVIAVNPPTVSGLGNYGGFQFELQDLLGTSSLNSMLQVAGQLLQKGNQTPGLQAVFTTFTANAPQIVVEVDRNKAKALQVPIDSIFNSLQSFFGSQYVNDFNFLSRTYRVYIQGDTKFRSNPQDINLLNVRSSNNQMIPLSSLIKLQPKTGAETITHYNLLRSIEINGSSAPGYSSGQATSAMEKLAHEILPASIGYEWSGVVAEEKKSGGLAPIIFGLGLVFVYLVLAAQYENYVDPLIIMLAVPLAILGALWAQSLRGLTNDVYCQVGLVMLIGLASKNAILIVEFANQLQEQGFSLTKAAIEAGQERLRPILMTSLAFILGLWPLVVAEGAGAASRQSLGTAVAGGMIVSTILSLFIVPILYIVIGMIRQKLAGHRHPQKF